jgi:hypothetical protein
MPDTRSLLGRICESNSNLPAVIHRSRISAFEEFVNSMNYEFKARHLTDVNHCTFYGLPLPENLVFLRTV